MNFKITSRNRNAAKRLLSTWHDSRIVRNWPLSMLQAKLEHAIREGLITEQSVATALDEKARHNRAPDKADARKYDNDDDAQREETVPVDSDDDGDDDAQHQDSDSDSDSDGEDNDGDNDGDSDSESDSESDSDSDSDSEQEQEQEKPQEPQPYQSNEQHPFVTHPQLQETREQDRAFAQAHLSLLSNRIDAVAKTAVNPKVLSKLRADLEALSKSVAKQQTRRIEIVSREKPPVLIEGAHEKFETVLSIIRAGLNVALVGPAGSGKSTLVAHVAKALQKPFRGCGALLSKYDLVGYSDANGVYHETPLFDAYLNGYLFCFDELDASAPDAVVAFNAVTDNQTHYAFPCGMREKHAGFVAVACMNTYGIGATSEYVGRYKQDAAAMSRFVRVQVDYDRKIEAQLGDDDICNLVWALREKCEALGVKHVVSTRMIIQAQGLREVGMSNREITQTVFFPGVDDETKKRLSSNLPKLGA